MRNSTNKNKHVQIFLIYQNQTDKKVHNECVIPLCTGFNKFKNKYLRDNTGDNIASQNKNYGEITAHYWVWKNYLKDYNPEYIGFCHYKRMFDFENFNYNLSNPAEAFIPCKDRKINKIIKRYSQKNIYKQIKNFDIILAHQADFTPNLMIDIHPQISSEILHFADIVKNKHPKLRNITDEFITGKTMYIGTIFVMKTELFKDWMNWIIPLIKEYRNLTDLSKFDGTYEERILAFLYERFFNVWMKYKIEQNNIRICSKDCYIIISPQSPKKLISNFISKFIKTVKLIIFLLKSISS